MKDREPLIIRADASPNIGTGHVMRCLALAEAWQDRGGGVIFVSACDVPVIHERLKKEGFSIYQIPREAGTLADAEDTIRIAHEHGVDWIVIDGYLFGAGYQKQIKDSGLSLLFIDDYGHADYYYADIVLNQNIYADMLFYKNYEPYTRFLLGTKYVLLRREFEKWSGWQREIPDVARKILVTLGGGDPDNVTLKVIEALKTVDVDGLEVKVVVGGANPHFDLLLETVKDLSNFSLIKNTDAMPELMAWADIAISGGGSTCWELAFMGVPSLVIPIAENQEPVILGISAQNATVIMGRGHIVTQIEISNTIKNVMRSIEMRSDLSKNSKKIVDGEGVSRAIMNICSNPIRLRTVGRSDCLTIFNWANDPEVRKSAFNTDHIPIADHKLWFFQKISDPNCHFFLGLNKADIAIGQVRFDVLNDVATVDISIDKNWRGKGYAKSLLDQGIDSLFKTCNVTLVKAYIKKENTNSIKMFMSCIFEFSGNEIINNSESIVLSRKKYGFV